MDTEQRIAEAADALQDLSKAAKAIAAEVAKARTDFRNGTPTTADVDAIEDALAALYDANAGLRYRRAIRAEERERTGRTHYPGHRIRLTPGPACRTCGNLPSCPHVSAHATACPIHTGDHRSRPALHIGPAIQALADALEAEALA